jgi:hypothetical protein
MIEVTLRRLLPEPGTATVIRAGVARPAVRPVRATALS